MSESEVLTILRGRVFMLKHAKYPRVQKQIARQMGCSGAFLNACLHGRKKLSPRVLRWLRVRKIVSYERMK